MLSRSWWSRTVFAATGVPGRSEKFRAKTMRALTSPERIAPSSTFLQASFAGRPAALSYPPCRFCSALGVSSRLRTTDPTGCSNPKRRVDKWLVPSLPSALQMRHFRPRTPTNQLVGRVAQLVERSLSMPRCMRKVLGSIPSSSTLGANGLVVRIQPFQG